MTCGFLLHVLERPCLKMAQCWAVGGLLIYDVRKLFIGKTAGKRLFKKIALVLAEPRGKIKVGKTNMQRKTIVSQGKGFQPVPPVVGFLQSQYVPQLVFQHSVRGLSIGLWITVPSVCIAERPVFLAGPTSLARRIWRGSRREGAKNRHTIKLDTKQVPQGQGPMRKMCLKAMPEGEHLWPGVFMGKGVGQWAQVA